MKRLRIVIVMFLACLISTQALASSVKYFRNPAFKEATSLMETGNYKVLPLRREVPGVAEVHLKDTDIMYIVEGSATLITGGSVVDPKTTAQDELRGPSIKGGEAQHLAKGDVIIVPNGVPHWFREVTNPFDYYVVKVTQCK